jgi:hypothetical protein
MLRFSKKEEILSMESLSQTITSVSSLWMKTEDGDLSHEVKPKLSLREQNETKPSAGIPSNRPIYDFIK